MEAEMTPPDMTAEERWIVENIVTAIRVEYRMTSADTADTYVHLTGWEGQKACWRDTTFAKVARLRLDYNSCAEPLPGIREKVEARKAWERKNARELAEYRRLKAKFEA